MFEGNRFEIISAKNRYLNWNRNKLKTLEIALCREKAAANYQKRLVIMKELRVLFSSPETYQLVPVLIDSLYRKVLSSDEQGPQPMPMLFNKRIVIKEGFVTISNLEMKALEIILRNFSIELVVVSSGISPIASKETIAIETDIGLIPSILESSFDERKTKI